MQCSGRPAHLATYSRWINAQLWDKIYVATNTKPISHIYISLYSSLSPLSQRAARESNIIYLTRALGIFISINSAARQRKAERPTGARVERGGWMMRAAQKKFCWSLYLSPCATDFCPAAQAACTRDLNWYHSLCVLIADTPRDWFATLPIVILV